MLDVIERLCRQSIDADAVSHGVDDGLQCRDQPDLVGLVADHFEDGLLDAVTVRLTDLGYPAETTLPRRGDGLDVVRDEKVHVS